MSARILVIDDMVQMLDFLSLYLKKAGFEVRTAKNFELGLALLEEEVADLILMDVVMPGTDGYEACSQLKKNPKYSNIPVIFVTSCDSGDAIRKCFDAGAVDYVNKHATQRELLIRVKTHLKLAEASKRQHQSLLRFSKAMDAFPHDILVLYPDGRIIFINESAKQLCGLDDSVGHLSDIAPQEARLMGGDLLEQVLHNKEAADFKKTFGHITRVITMVPVIDEFLSESEFVFIISRDVSEHEEMERHLRQSRKMESLSLIAGGAAHDLNNILGGILGYTSMARMNCEDTQVEKFIAKAESAAEKAAAVISQLLNFASQTEPKIEDTAINCIVEAAVKLLDAPLGNEHRYKMELHNEPMLVRVDRYLVQQALLNLLLSLEKKLDENATIKITTTTTFNRNTLLPFRDEDIFGDYIKIIISDESFNQRQGKISRVDFTKNNKLVSGLGVAIVAGIVKDFKGVFYLHGDSPSPRGFTLCFPLIHPPEVLPTKPGRILILDKEKLFVQMVKDLMDLLGYEAVFCSNAKNCLDEHLKNADQFDVLMLDYGERELMPVTIMEEFQQANPDLKVLLTSSRQVEEVSMIADLQSCSFIEKPFKMKEFSIILKQLMDKADS